MALKSKKRFEKWSLCMMLVYHLARYVQRLIAVFVYAVQGSILFRLF